MTLLRLVRRPPLILVVTSVAIFAVATLAGLGILLDNSVRQSECQHYANEIAAAIGDGLGSPDSKAMAALTPTDATVIRKSRSAYQQALRTASGTTRTDLETAWYQYWQQQKTQAQADNGC